MKLSRESQYGIAALSYLATQPHGTILQVAEVAEGADLPKAFLAKIFRKLSVYGILVSHRGKERGFEFARPPAEINLREVIEAIEGPDIFTRCIFWSGVCSTTEPCQLHPIWAKIRPLLAEELSAMSIAQPPEQIEELTSRIESSV